MYSLSCKDMGKADCDFVATGETQEEVMKSVGEHAMAVHGMTEADMTDDAKKMMMDKMVQA